MAKKACRLSDSKRILNPITLDAILPNYPAMIDGDQMGNPGSYFANPQGTVARWCDAVAVSVAGLCSFLSYYLIEFSICRDYRCEDFVVTSFHASMSWLYLVFGLALLGVGVFLVVARDLPRAFALAITVSSLSGLFLSGMIVFAMLGESRQML